MNDKPQIKSVGTGDGSAMPDAQMDECNAICPHCLESYQVEGEDCTDYEVEEECDHCGKKYLRCTSFEVTHHTRPLPNNVLGATE